MNIKEAMIEIRQINDEHGFNSAVPKDNPAIFCEKMLLVISEISEALEEFRNGRGLDEVYYNDTPDNPHPKPEGIPIEIADAIIRIFDFCEANDIDLVGALREKMHYNKTRPYRHGGKKV